MDENTVLEVGKFYNVRCALMKNEFGTRYLMPVIGEPHFDLQFGFPHKHLHVDGRFCGKTEMSWIRMDKNGMTNYVCQFPPSEGNYTIEDIVVRRRKCKRLTTGLNPPKVKLFHPHEKSSWIKWYNTMIGKSCKGKRCPHLGTKMLEQNGHLFCPLHNLKGSLKTEKIIY